MAGCHRVVTLSYRLEQWHPRKQRMYVRSFEHKHDAIAASVVDQPYGFETLSITEQETTHVHLQAES